MCDLCPDMIQMLNAGVREIVEAHLRECLSPAQEKPFKAPKRIQELVDSWNELGKPYGRVVALHPRMMLYTHIKARLKSPFFVSNMRAMLDEFRDNPFLRGEITKDGKPQRAFNFRWWVASDDNAAKIMEWRDQRLAVTSNRRKGKYE